MNILWGAVMIALGLFLVVCASLKTNFILYRLVHARSKQKWGDKAHLFHQISGGMVLAVGILLVLGVIGANG